MISENRIDIKFKALKASGKSALIPFITAGDPDLDTTASLVLSMEKAGADIVELGIPYSDPIADGVVIQEASFRSLSNGFKIKLLMDTVKKIRLSSDIPLVYMLYYNSIFKYGMEKFISEAKASGIDGLIVPDIPLEERDDLKSIAEASGIYLIPLVAPTSKERIQRIVSGSKGFIYCVSTNGVTGARNTLSTDIKSYMETVSQYSDTPKALGFGISSPEMAEKYKSYCDGIIVGSALVKKIADAENTASALETASKFIRSMKAVL